MQRKRQTWREGRSDRHADRQRQIGRLRLMERGKGDSFRKKEIKKDRETHRRTIP